MCSVSTVVTRSFGGRDTESASTDDGLDHFCNRRLKRHSCRETGAVPVKRSAATEHSSERARTHAILESRGEDLALRRTNRPDHLLTGRMEVHWVSGVSVADRRHWGAPYPRPQRTSALTVSR
jgi:hypothetical protein